ncbi:BlaI/MecI/CopY family transcriptional regulator [candidate division KSB1 bacterium]|nr:BlaI/MecI/CopY family transcriptional regulator [candidate division KSB1 bacterium]
MKLLWEKSPRTANEIVDALAGNVDWNAQTIRTLINRLVQKGAITFEKDGRAYLYHAKVKESDVQHAETRSFVSRVFNGAMKPMIAAFLQETELSESEIDELERLLKEKKSKN